MRAHIVTVTLRLSPSFGFSSVNLAFANSKAVTTALAGPSHNFAVKGSMRNKQTSRSFGPPGHHASSDFRQGPFYIVIAHDASAARPAGLSTREQSKGRRPSRRRLIFHWSSATLIGEFF
jgi:hypothetical protein